MMVQAGVIPNPVGWSGAAETHPYFVCDVFTSEPLEGNQLAIDSVEVAGSALIVAEGRFRISLH